MSFLRASRVSPASQAKGAQTVPYTVPAPTGGLNAREGFTQMAPNDAVTLTNWFPEAQYVAVRNGSASWIGGMGASTTVQSLIPWYNPAGSDKMFAAAGTKIYDVSNSGGSASSVVTGLTTAIFQWTNFTTPGGSFLVACNGVDHVQNYNGTTWTNPSITGVADTTLIGVTPFMNRLWFIQTNTLNLYYLGTQSISGAATQFPLGSVFRLGGQIMAIGDFSYDAGDGQYAYFVIITSNGEVAVYQGTDPSSITTWNLVGVYRTASPITRRCIIRLNGDLGILTVDGVISLRGLLQFDRSSDQKAAVTGKIQTLFSTLAQSYSANVGWDMMLYPQSRYLIVNVPVISNSQQIQLVMNTVTGAWCKFTGLNAWCWGTANGLLYFGGNNGTVYQANTGTTDSSSTITATLQTAWNLLGSPEKKMAPQVKPIMPSGGGMSYTLGVNWDFDTTVPVNSVTVPTVAGAVWPMTWPWTWGGTQMISNQWQAAGGLGTWASISLVTTANTAATLDAFSVRVQPGMGMP
jgi:hypothetical protein